MNKSRKRLKPTDKKLKP